MKRTRGMGLGSWAESQKANFWLIAATPDNRSWLVRSRSNSTSLARDPRPVPRASVTRMSP